MLADTPRVPVMASKVFENKWFQHIAFGLLAFGSWELYARWMDNFVLLPPPSRVAYAFYDMTVSGQLIPALQESLFLLLVGFIAAFVFAFVFGVIIGRYHVMDLTLSPYFNALYALPTVALVPLVLVWLGFGFSGRLLVVLLAAFFPMLINIYTGVKAPPQDIVEVAKSFGVRSEFGMLRQVVLPAAIPFIMAGVRLGIGRAVVGMAVAEVYMRLSGIGALITSFGSVFKTDYVMAAIAPLPLLGIGLTQFFAYFERRLAYYRME